MSRHKYIRDTGILNTDKNRFYSIKNNCTELSKIYNVSISTIDRIVRNITWRNI